MAFLHSNLSQRLFIPFRLNLIFPSLSFSLLTSLVSFNCTDQGRERRTRGGRARGIQMMSLRQLPEQDTDSHHSHWFQYRHTALYSVIFALKYGVNQLLVDNGWVDLYLACSTILLGQ